MLPSHLMDSSLRKNEPRRQTRLGEMPPAPGPSLCITGAMSRVGRFEPSPGISLAFTIFRPRQLLDDRRPPLIVCHGGPSIPSNYLLPIVNGVTDRAIVFYDMWGCGKSSRPSRLTNIPFSIPTMVEHLQGLIQHWKVKKFHLYGHSFGGILAYEYLKTERTGCLSLVLGSTPTSPKLIQEECFRLDHEIRNTNGTHQSSSEKDNDDNDEATEKEETIPKRPLRFSEAFLQTHECRLPALPLALMDALAQAGPPGWRGAPAIIDYEALERMCGIPTLVLVGEYDFCTPACTEGWKTILSDPEFVSLDNCSHYGMLEDESKYGKAITSFVQQHDAPKEAGG